jgi:hypothetical protein
MAEPSEMEVTNPEGLDAIFRAHYERIVNPFRIRSSSSANPVDARRRPGNG